MSPFNGFTASTGKNTPMPAVFFTELLPEINDLIELKVILWAFRVLDQQEGNLRYLTVEDFSEVEGFFTDLGKNKEERTERLNAALESAVRRGVFLLAQVDDENYYILNSPRGRAALEALENGAWLPGSQPKARVKVERPNIFSLYEQNIGPLTPLLSDELRDAEKSYPEDWINDAFKIAVTRNARNWRYIDAILRQWKEKGRDERDQRSPQEDRKLDSEGEYGDYILH